MIARSGITLSPSKCHFAYQSLLLLGQKVSRLGLSMHREKVNAILQLDQPQNISELQTFLGMMVYFLAYIPFYSWIAHPFLVLKESLIKFQPFLEGEKILAIMDHAALMWSKTFQNVNWCLLTWGTVFSAYPHLWIVHHAGHVHSNIDPIS